MNNKLPLIIGALIVAAVGGFLLFSRNGGPGESLTGGASPNTLAELMILSENYMCTFQDVGETGDTTDGTVYVANSGSQFRGNFTSNQANGTAEDTFIIRNDNTTHVWGAGMETGVMMTADPAENQGLFPETGEGNDSAPVDENEEIDLSCQRWTVDGSLFVPPGDVEFVDFSAQLEMMNEQMETVEQPTNDQVDCSVCDQIPAGQGRDQCLVTFGC